MMILPQPRSIIPGTTDWQSEERPVHVDGVDLAPIIDGHFGEGFRLPHTGVVDKNVHAAELGNRIGDHPIDLSLIRNVGDRGDCVRSQVAGLGGDRFGLVPDSSER